MVINYIQQKNGEAVPINQYGDVTHIPNIDEKKNKTVVSTFVDIIVYIQCVNEARKKFIDYSF